MHNLALALEHQGHNVSGSDDEIFEPSRGRLASVGLLPSKMGWDAENITAELDLVILGMHAREDNPELQKAIEIGLKVMSFPEYIASQSANKTRIVVGGSHGKTTTTAMIMHVLKVLDRDFDYLVGSLLDGFERMVKLSDADLIIIEGDEYLSSAIDRKPKFLWYRPNVAIVTGIAWDHINVFPTFEEYLLQFELFRDSLAPEASLIYYKGDEYMPSIAAAYDGVKLPYSGLDIRNMNGTWGIQFEYQFYPMKIFGDHNFQNVHAALLALEQIGISFEDGLKAMQSFNSTARRLELIYDEKQIKIFRDFAHSPSKVKATVEAVRKSFPEHFVFGVLELHTFSSLQREFLPHYNGTMDAATRSVVFFEEHVFEMKRLPKLNGNEVREAFGKVEISTEKDELIKILRSVEDRPIIYLMMSSGSFSGMKFPDDLVLKV